MRRGAFGFCAITILPCLSLKNSLIDMAYLSSAGASLFLLH
jgi:hypothetical protein